MKNFLRASIFIFAFGFSAFSQTTENSNCPTLSVSGPPGVADPGEPIIFTAILDEKSKNYNVEYLWSVSDGEIIKGQGTQIVTIVQPQTGTSVTARVEIKGLPEGCANYASEMTSPFCGVANILFDEFTLSEQRIDKARLDYFFTELNNHPNDQGYIIEKFKRNTSKAVIKQKLAKISSYIKIRGFDPTKIIIVHAFADENRTQLFRVPVGATPPTID